jgi:hypothetical protein
LSIMAGFEGSNRTEDNLSKIRKNTPESRPNGAKNGASCNLEPEINHAEENCPTQL